MKTSLMIARESGLSMRRVQTIAQKIGVEKFGKIYVWSEEDEQKLYEQKGKVGKPRKKKYNEQI